MPRSRAAAIARANDSRAVRASRRKSGASSAQRHISGGPVEQLRVAGHGDRLAQRARALVTGAGDDERHAEREPRGARLDAVVARR